MYAAKKEILDRIRRTITSRSKEIMLRLHKSLVRPHLEYCIQAWRPHLVKDIDILEKVQ
jgi:ribonucleases P/MRP protein subunit RPP40